MKIRITILIIILSVLLNAGIDVGGNSYTIASSDKNTQDNYFENWTEITAKYNKFSGGLRFESHNPPLPFSPDTTGYGIYQKYLQYQNNNFQVILGNFYGMLGRGLVLRSFENRTLRWDTNIEGFKTTVNSKWIDGKFLAGKPRDRSGIRLKRILAGELTLKPMDIFHLGFTGLKTQDFENQPIYRSSAYTNINLDYVSLYSEYAGRKDENDWGNGYAFYVSADMFINSFTMRTEYKNYDNYQLSHGSLYEYNNPPTVVREHLYTLLNRHQHVINANDEIGWLFESTFPLTDFALVTANFNSTDNQAGNKIYREYYGQMELYFSENWEWVLASGHEKDREARYLNFVLSSSYNLDYVNAFKFIYEHQHIKILFTNRQFYSQIYHLEYTRAPLFTFSLIGERTTQQTSHRKFWFGGQIDFQLFTKYDISIFGGTRREGKMCAGGVCVYKPEFEGVEATFNIRL